jgi:hypothetical protein
MRFQHEVDDQPADMECQTGPDIFVPRVFESGTVGSPAYSGIVVGELIGITDDGRTPLVMYPGQPGPAAIAARSALDVHGAHIGRQVVLMFEAADPAKPIVMGILREGRDSALQHAPGYVEVDRDGERLIVSAQEQLVFRCGKASITLTKEGKVLIQGKFVSTRSSGVLRLKGGSVQLN